MIPRSVMIFRRALL